MEKQKAREVLRRAQDDEKIVCLYTSRYSENFAAGFVEAVSENQVVLRSLTPHGRYDGWLLRVLENISRIDSGGRYEEKLLALFRARGQNHPHFLPPTDETTDLISEMLICARRSDCAVRIDIGADDDNEGFVKEVEATTITIEKFDVNGQIDSESVIELEHIEKIAVDDEDLQDLKILAHWRDL